jgi:chromosome segregation ATPase
MRNRYTLLFALVLAATFNAHAVLAQTIEDRLRDQLRVTMQQLHQLQDDQASLQAQKVAAEQERDALKVQLAAAKAQQGHGGVDRGQVQALAAQVSKYKDAASQASGTAAQAQADHDKLTAELANAQLVLGACETKNGQLLNVGMDILKAYEKFDFGEAMGADEPFIGIKRVELENLAQDFGDRLYDGKFNPQTVRPTTQPSPATQPSQDSHK